MSGKEFLASIFISLIIIGVTTLFVMPIIYPSIQNDSRSIILQTHYKEFSSLAQILDNQNISWMPVPDTELNITIKDESKIMAIFTANYVLGLSDTLGDERVGFYISLNVEEVGSKIARIAFHEDNPYGSFREISGTLYINYMTNSLPAGQYTISVSWISMRNGTDLSFLLFTTPLANFTRSLLVTEYAT